MKKELKDYFSEWSKVSVTSEAKTIGAMEKEISQMSSWCWDNLGMKGKYWETEKYATVQPRGKMGLSFGFMFKKEEDALLFIMTFGGVIVRNQ